jgi:hypothetical protein
MDFKVTKVPAEFATEAYAMLHHMCTVANLPDQDMLLRSAGIRPGHKPGPRKVHRVEGSADKPGCRKKVPHLDPGCWKKMCEAGSSNHILRKAR